MKLFSFAVDYGGDRGTETLVNLESKPSFEEFLKLCKDHIGDYDEPRGFFLDTQEGMEFTTMF